MWADICTIILGLYIVSHYRHLVNKQIQTFPCNAIVTVLKGGK